MGEAQNSIGGTYGVCGLGGLFEQFGLYIAKNSQFFGRERGEGHTGGRVELQLDNLFYIYRIFVLFIACQLW